jgi:hypothetical protein
LHRNAGSSFVDILLESRRSGKRVERALDHDDPAVFAVDPSYLTRLLIPKKYQKAATRGEQIPLDVK